MQRKRFDSLLAGAAVAAILAVIGTNGALAQGNPDTIEASVPMPDTSPLPPPTVADIAPISAPARPEVSAAAQSPAQAARSQVHAEAVQAPEAAASVGEQASQTTDRETTERRAVYAPELATPATNPSRAAEVSPAEAAAPVEAAVGPTVMKPIPRPAPRTDMASQSTPDQPTGTVASDMPALVADAGIADLLRGQDSNRLNRILSGQRDDRTSVESFYSQRNFAPLWVTDGQLNERGRAAIAYLESVGSHGLQPSEYAVPQFTPGSGSEALAEAEIGLTSSILSYVRHARMGRVHFTRLRAEVDYDLPRPVPAEVLGALASSNDLAATLDGYQPQHAGYQALREKLAEARQAGGRNISTPRLPQGNALRITRNQQGREVIPNDPRVPILRARLDIDGDRKSTAYDRTVAEAVTRFQKEQGLPATGRLTRATVDAINGPERGARDIDIIIANLERWRWMPRDLGRNHVMVNIPDYTLSVKSEGQRVWKTNIVVGRADRATPLISSDMTFMTVNPTWNVPPSIIRREYLPALQRDPRALDRMGLRVAHNANGTVRVWQPPGDKNALGRIRFNFPNQFLVFQHDTPDKHLFKHNRRAYSAGCMRVEDPSKYGEVLLSLARPGENYTAARLRGMYGNSEVNIRFPEAIPVHLTYQTAFVDDSGKLVIRDDVYGHDKRMIEILNGSDRRVAETAVPRLRNTASVPARIGQGSVAGARAPATQERDRVGTNFFDRMFSGQPPRAQASQQQQRPRSARTNEMHRIR